MPNFKARINFDKINEYFKSNYELKTRFDFITKEQNGVRLVSASIENKSFFIQLKNQGEYHLIKLDKHSKIDDMALMIMALSNFKNMFCDDVVHSTLSTKRPKLSLNVIDAKKLLQFLPKYEKVILEIGFGSARQLLYQAQNNDKNTLIVGLEVYKPGVLQASKMLGGYENVVLLNEDARFVLDILPKHSIDKILLHFPVPWNDSKTRRVISDEFFKNLAYVLKKDGIFWLRTDDFEYFEDAKIMLKDFILETKINEKDNITSKYEDRWLRLEKDIYDIYAKNTNDINKLDINFNLNDIKVKKIKPQKILKDGYFLNIERMYDIDKSLQTYEIPLILKISYGSFTKPFHAYILNDAFLFNKPYFCSQNISALKELKTILGE